MPKARTFGGACPSWVEVTGFKSLMEPGRIELRPLTLLSGANSSGKSSILQPLLMMKQAEQSQFSPSTLLVKGDHVSFTSPSQFLSRGRAKASQVDQFEVVLGAPKGDGTDVRFIYRRASRTSEKLNTSVETRHVGADDWVLLNDDFNTRHKGVQGAAESKLTRLMWLTTILHLPGHRGHRERAYPATSVSSGPFSEEICSVLGPMHPYAASLLQRWKKESATEKLAQVSDGLRRLGLTWKVKSKSVDALSLQLRVGRVPTPQQGGAQDLVDIADVGFGLSQVLPVLVGLAAAAPGQMVLIEQPELHLHPRAQLAMGGVLAEAAKRGVVVVVETHSQLLLRAIQTIVATGELVPDQVGLHWFTRDAETGWSTVKRADLHEDGTFGDWPVDFPDVFSMADEAFIDAVFSRQTT